MLQSFRTARLSVSPLQLQEAPEMSALLSTPAVARWISTLENDCLSLRRAKALIASQERARRHFLGVRVEDGTFAGIVLFKLLPSRDVEVGYVIGVDHQGKGYATEALQGVLGQLSVHPDLAGRRVVAQTERENGSSINVLQKAGFRPGEYEGVRPGRVAFVLNSVCTGKELEAQAD